jgi:acyl CoA:acetate/3-ketoacid CoA transferase alpha subunit
MLQFPKLTPQARHTLEIIVGSTVIDGSSLMKKMSPSLPADIVTFIRELQMNDLIEVGGNVTVDELPFCQFGVRPSVKEYLNSYLKQSMA